MRKNILFIVVAICATTTLFAQQVDSIGFLSYQIGVNDVWGYTDSTGHEYALVGTEDGVSIVDVSTDPSNPTELFFINGANSGWRDMKVWGEYVYSTNETAGGLMIIDVSDLPNSISNSFYSNTNDTVFGAAHNLYIDENGFCYIVGASAGVGGIIILDLNQDALNPPQVGYYDERYVHDIYVRGDTAWSAEINDGIVSVLDVSDKSNITVLAQFATPMNFAHNCWLNDAGTHLFTTDELSGAWLGAYDVSDLSNITETDRWRSNPGSGVVPHNSFVLGDYLYTSYYADGVTIHDISDPNNMVLVGSYDTSPFSGDGFVGSWGVYPYFSSGLILASDMNRGLFVLDDHVAPAARVAGQVTDDATNFSLNNVRVTILNTNVEPEFTDLTGNYATGYYMGGSVDIEYRKAGYFPDTMTVALVSGQTVTQNVSLIPKPTFTQVFEILDMETLQPVADALINVSDPEIQHDLQTDINGQAFVLDFYAGEYTTIAGKWGYLNAAIEEQEIGDNGVIRLYLHPGYGDNFSLDLGWQSIGTTGTGGEWVREVPFGTAFQGFPVSPEFDSESDFGNHAYLTGNSALFDFVNGGTVRLESPFFNLSGYDEAYLSYSRWFINANQAGTLGNDSMLIEISNGFDTVTLEKIIHESVQDVPSWIDREYFLSDYITLTPNMKFSITAYADQSQTELLDGAFDAFQVIDSANLFSPPTGIELTATPGSEFLVFPNPSSGSFLVRIPNGESIEKAVILNANGIQMAEYSISENQEFVSFELGSTVRDGVYFLQLESQNGVYVKPVSIFK